MRTKRRPAALAALLISAGSSLVLGTSPAYANHLQYVAPTEYEAEHSAPDAQASPEEGYDAQEAEAPYGYADGSLAQSMAAIRWCESSNDYTANTGNGYYGAYQFAAETWWWLGYAGWPHEAAPSVQDEAAVALYNIFGWSPWPACSRALGLL